jgi:hypothetical protein
LVAAVTPSSAELCLGPISGPHDWFALVGPARRPPLFIGVLSGGLGLLPTSLSQVCGWPRWARLSCLTVEVSDRRRNTTKSGNDRSESLCAGLLSPCRIFWAWFGLSFRPKSGSKSKISGRILKSVRGPRLLSRVDSTPRQPGATSPRGCPSAAAGCASYRAHTATCSSIQHVAASWRPSQVGC